MRHGSVPARLVDLERRTLSVPVAAKHLPVARRHGRHATKREEVTGGHLDVAILGHQRTACAAGACCAWWTKTGMALNSMRAYLGQPVSRTYANGPTPRAAAVLLGDPAGVDFAVTPAVWPAGTEVMYRVVTTNGDKGFRLSGNTFQRGGRKAGDVIAFYELARLDGGWTYGHSNRMVLA